MDLTIGSTRKKSQFEIFDIGMRALVAALGDVEAEAFVSFINREKPDYTKWREQYFGSMTKEDIYEDMDNFFENYTYNGNADIIL